MDGASETIPTVADRCELSDMGALSNFVTLHPYFKVHPGKLETVKAGFPWFVEETKTEEKNLFCEFTVNGDEMFCGFFLAENENRERIVLVHSANFLTLFNERPLIVVYEFPT